MAEINKYLDTLAKYKTNLKDDAISAEVKGILSKNFAKNVSPETYKTLFSCLDFTSLNATDTRESIWKFTDIVNNYDDTIPYPNVAAICVYPNMVEVVKDALTADVKVVSVAGGFPSSQTFIEVKMAEVALAKAMGADEIDIVMNLGYFMEGNYQELSEEISEIKDSCEDTKLKVILETGALKTAENIMKASLLALYSGADFIKTSTGKIEQGATLEAAYVMCKAIKEYTTKTGIKAGFKASGGISTAEDATMYYTIVKEVLGEEYLNKEYFRIGASKLAADLVTKIG